MLRRPKPTDSEDDILREQQRFLTSGTSPSAASVVRRPDKRRGEQENRENTQRDIVTIEDLPDELPTLTAAPPKKSRFKKAKVRFEDEDAGERLDRQDTHISAVLSRIIERDTTTVPVCLPAVTGSAFPKVMRRSDDASQGNHAVPGAKKSIFARQIAAQRAKEGGVLSQQTPVLVVPEVQAADVASSVDTKKSPKTCAGGSNGPVLVTGQGLAQGDSSLERAKIHQENQARLEGMSQEEILEEQRRLLAQLDPRLVGFVRACKAEKMAKSDLQIQLQSNTENQTVTKEDEAMIGCSASNISDTRQEPQVVDMADDMVNTEDSKENEATEIYTEEELPFKRQKDWIHMDKLEPEKLEWTRDLPKPRRKSTKKAMQARFDFSGNLIPPTEDLPTHLGLHHHGDEPELAGYSLQDLFILSRSLVSQQRTLALTTLANIITKAREGGYVQLLKGSILSTMLDAGLLFLLRFSLDDSVEAVMAAATQALRALLVSVHDEEFLDRSFYWLLGMASFPLLPIVKEEEEEDEEDVEGGERVTNAKERDKEKEERKSDHELARQDVVKGLLRMKVLPRIRYILEVVRPSPRTVLDLLEILVRIARHSTPAAIQILDCPRLMNAVMSEFLPSSWAPPTSPAPESLYGLPVAMAMKLLRVLGMAGRHTCARLLNSLGGKERLSLLLAMEPSELLLEAGEAFRCSIESFRMWAVAASYGQACDLYSDLYPHLMKAVQSLTRPCCSEDQLEVQRRQTILLLLTQVTHTAGGHQELQSSLSNPQESECPPPPPVSWGHVTGLQPTVIGQLKVCVRGLDVAGQQQNSLGLLPSYLFYLGAYYSQLIKQKCFQPVECLMELESLTSEVLLPLITHQRVQRMIEGLKSCSAVCNPASCSPGPEALACLPRLSCSGDRTTGVPLGPGSPFPLLTSFCYLMDAILEIHKGLAKKIVVVLLHDPVLVYLHGCIQAMPPLTHSSAWLLRHEHHLLFLLLRLAHRLVPVDPEMAKQASLFHQVALVMLPWLLPGSEYIAHELISSIVFNHAFIPEHASGGPEAASLAELHLQEDSSSCPPPLLAPLLRESCSHLPSLRGCYLTHLAHLEPQVLTSRNLHLGRTPWLCSLLLPELSSGPILPSDWPYLPIVSMYGQMAQSNGGYGSSVDSDLLPASALISATHCLRWLVLLESWREGALRVVPPVAKLARLACVFLVSSDLFLEPPVQRLTQALLGMLTEPQRLAVLDLSIPPPGLASFHDLYAALLVQYEAVSFGDVLFGCFLLLPLQRRYSATMRLALFGEHVGLLRSLAVPLHKLPVPLENYTSPPEDSIPLLRLYFRVLVTGLLRRCWCPVLYVVAVAHVNAFIFSQEPAAQEVEATRRSLLRKTYYLTDEVLRSHLLLYKLPQQRGCELGFLTYERLPPFRARWMEKTLGLQEGTATGTAADQRTAENISNPINLE